ncbi:ATPase RavA stimulator ViaA [Enterobacteriaceae bacterium LUAb1]
MITLNVLSLHLAISENDLIEKSIVTLLDSPQLAIFSEKYPGLKKALIRDLPRWKAEMAEKIKESFVPTSLAEEFNIFQQTQHMSLRDFSTHLPTRLTTLISLDSVFSNEATRLVAKADTTQAYTPAFQALFLQRWRLSLVLQTLTFSQKVLEEVQNALLEELQQRLAVSIQLVAAITDDNERVAGRLWDMTAGKLHRDDDQLLVRYSDFLKRQPQLRKLAETLGRSRNTTVTQSENTPAEQTHQQVRAPQKIPDEINTLYQSDDILRLLPTELATLGISELELEFYRRLIEKQLVTYRLQGEAWQEKTILRPVTQQQQHEAARGPFIVCVDTSGSMGGGNERCAKAFCLALLHIALAENRRYYIMLFAHDVISYELTSHDGINETIRFLAQQFRGGTDLAACLRHACEKMTSPAWHEADAVIISDFIAQRLPEPLIRHIHYQQHEYKQRFHAVAMSDHGKPAIMRIFDHIWHFDMSIKNRLLRRFGKKI